MQSFELLEADLVCPSISPISSFPLHFDPLACVLLFHPGDDPDGKLGWAKPDFDDSSWPLLRSNTGWGEQGYKGYSGFAWYRFKVLLPDEHRRWAISLPRLLTSYQIFADNRLIGQFGGMPPHAQYVVGFDQIFALPADLPSPGHAVTFAIHHACGRNQCSRNSTDL